MAYILLQLIYTGSWAQGVVKGRIQDAKTGENIVGATVSIPDLRLSTSSNGKGEFILSNTPARGLFLIEVRYMGYKTSTQRVDFANTDVLVFKLGQSSIEGHEVVITGSTSSADNRKNSASISLVDREKLLNQSTNIMLRLDWAIGDATLTSISGYSDFQREESNDWDGGFYNDSSNINTTDLQVFSQELRLAGESDRLNWANEE